jgi:imidazoleglycerol-phosphate dehydratase
MGRSANLARTTKETSVEVSVDLDGTGHANVQTPLPFLTHMVEQIARHGLVDLVVRATGDVEIDGHHTTEDLGLVLGQAVAKALGDKSGIVRYGHATLPMDEARAACAIDLSGRAHFVWQVELPRGAKIGTWDVELAPVFFEAFARGAQCNLHIVLERGEILHHVVEICFKALARALREAVRVEPRVGGIPSTKGTLGD